MQFFSLTTLLLSTFTICAISGDTTPAIVSIFNHDLASGDVTTIRDDNPCIFTGKGSCNIGFRGFLLDVLD